MLINEILLFKTGPDHEPWGHTVYGTDESVILETMIVTIPDIRRNMFHSHLLFNNIYI